MPGRVCEKHERYVHEGEECPHCEPGPSCAVIDPRIPWTPRPLQPGETKCACGLWILTDGRSEIQEPTRLVSHMRERCIDYHGRKITKAAS